MIGRSFLILFTLFGSLSIFAQGYEDELGFKYIKAEYLIKTERFDDAIKELNAIIKVNDSYQSALLLRASTKYKLAAYRGAKNDVISYIETSGINYTAASLLGRSDFAMSNDDAALNSLTTALSIGGIDDEKLYEMRGTIYETKSMDLEACEDWNEAAKLGSTVGAINVQKNCAIYDLNPQLAVNIPRQNTTTTTLDTNANGPSGSSEVTSNEPDDLGAEYVSNEVYSNPSNPIPQDDNTPNEIFIDEDLTLAIFGQGLGKRRVLDRPSILILAEEDGAVAVDICVNQNGRIEYSEYNSSKSTLATQSLISLAIRKSKEFWFERSDFNKQCGTILFKIKGS